MSRVKNSILLVFVFLLTFSPLTIAKDAEFEGTDSLAQKAVSEINKDYKPWFKPVWTPPSTEVETFLFALQAAIGAGFVGYFIGLTRGRNGK